MSEEPVPVQLNLCGEEDRELYATDLVCTEEGRLTKGFPILGLQFTARGGEAPGVAVLEIETLEGETRQFTLSKIDLNFTILEEL